MDLKWLKHREPVASLFSTRVYNPQFISDGWCIWNESVHLNQCVCIIQEELYLLLENEVSRMQYSLSVKLSLEFLCHCILNPLLEDIESRSSRKESVQILSECHKLYCEQDLKRRNELTKTATQRLNPEVSPEPSFLKHTGRMESYIAIDQEMLNAY